MWRAWRRVHGRAGRGRRLEALPPQVLRRELGGGLPLRARDRKQQLLPKFWQRPVPVSQVWEQNTGLRGEGAARGGLEAAGAPVAPARYSWGPLLSPPRFLTALRRLTVGK